MADDQSQQRRAKIRDKDDNESDPRIAALEKENRRLRRENRACIAQGLLFENLLEMVGSVSEKKVLRHTMEKALDITARLSGAETGSLFLLDDAGVVTDSILTRGKVDPEIRSALIGTVLDKGLAGWVRARQQVGLVSDTLTDDRWISLPDEPYRVRSALAVPIIKHRSLFGILTLMHSEPVFFTRESVETVELTAGHMALAIEGAQIYLKNEELNRIQRQAFDRDLTLARQVQESFLPARMPDVQGYAFAAVNQPAQAVGGDFYHFYTLPGNRLGIALGDVSGKGIAASLFMARLSSELQHYAPIFIEPGRLMAKINRVLCGRAKQGMFVTLIYMVVDLDTGIVLFANAGHIPPVHMDGGKVMPLQDRGFKGPPLGIVPEAAYGQESIVLGEHSSVLLCTDGVLEARNKAGEIYGMERLCKAVKTMAAPETDSLPGPLLPDPDGLVKGIVRDVDRFSQGRGGHDDLTLACVCRTSVP